ncbi:LppA family lipoprotein [Nocardia sp. NPDC051756]|uniref:LppA family lipoprotein n=1 Tax=Nocardia sp. NPDC051756 TaxID=3154751 RepID=UPI00342F2348
MTTKAVARVVASVIVAAVVSGCGDSLKDPYRPAPKADIAEAAAKMRKLPSVEATERDLMAVISQIAEATKAAAPGLDWQTVVNRNQSKLGCPSPYLETEGVSISTDRLTSAVPIADDEWAAVLQIARDIAARNGITSFTVRADQPGRHDVVLHSPDQGNEIKLATAKAALIGGVTGCRYREVDLHKQPGN